MQMICSIGGEVLLEELLLAEDLLADHRHSVSRIYVQNVRYFLQKALMIIGSSAAGALYSVVLPR